MLNWRQWLERQTIKCGGGRGVNRGGGLSEVQRAGKECRSMIEKIDRKIIEIGNKQYRID